MQFYLNNRFLGDAFDLPSNQLYAAAVSLYAYNDSVIALGTGVSLDEVNVNAGAAASADKAADKGNNIIHMCCLTGSFTFTEY